MHDQLEKHNRLLGIRLNEYRNNQVFCDVILKCDDGTEFPAHRVILAAMSEYFHTSFCGGFVDSNSKVYNLGGVDPKSLANLLDYFYTGDIKITTFNVVEIIHAADFLLVKHLKEMCKKFMLSDLRSFTLIRYQFLSRQYFNCEIAAAEELEGQNVNFYDIFEDDFLLQLSFNQIKQLIQDKMLKHIQEKLFLSFVLKWVDVSAERKICLVELLDLVAWEYVPPMYLNKTLDIIYGEFPNHPVTRRIMTQLQKVDVARPLPAVHIIRSRAATTVCYAFIPTLDKWVSLAPLPYINISGCILKTTTLNNKLYVLCCKDRFATRLHRITRSYFLCYEPKTNQWTQLPCPLNNSSHDEELCIPAVFLVSSNDSVFYVNTYNSSLFHFNPETSRWKEIKLDCDRFHKDSNMFIKVYDGVLHILGLNVYHCSHRFTLVRMKLSDLSVHQVRLKGYYHHSDGNEIPQNAWQNDCRFRLSNCYKLRFVRAGCFELYNEYDECVCEIDTEECKLVFYHNKKAEEFSKSWQALGWNNQVFLAGTKDRSCALLDIDTGFWKYVEENPLFPHWTHQAFIMSLLELPPHTAEQSSM